MHELLRRHNSFESSFNKDWYLYLINTLLLNIFLIAIFFSNPTLANSSAGSTNDSMLKLQDKIRKISITQHLQHYIEYDNGVLANAVGPHIINQLNSSEFSTSQFNEIHLLSNKTHWLKVLINQGNKKNKQKEWLLEIRSENQLPQSDIQTFLINKPNSKNYETIESKNINILQQRDSDSKKFIFKLSDEKQSTLLIKITPSQNIKLSASLWNTDYIETNNSIIFYLIGAFYGALLILFIYNLALNISIGDITYSFFLLYIVTIALFMVNFSSLDSISFWRFLPDISFAAGSGLLFWGILLFLTLLETRRYSPVTANLLLLFLPLPTLLTLSSFFFSIQSLESLFSLSAAAIIILIMVAILKKWQLVGSYPANLYFLALMCMPLGIMLHVLHHYEVFPFEVIGYMSLHGAFIGHLLILSLGIITRTNTDNKMKYMELGKQYQSIVASRRSEDEMLSRALHDPLTGLPNRLALQKRTPEVIREAEIYQQSVAIILINLSRFHEINNTLGHQNGDELLKIVTSRLSDVASNLESSIVIDTDANNESIVNIEGVTYGMMLLVDTEQQVEFAAKRVLTSMRKHFEFRDISIDIGARLGIALYPQHGKDLDTLIRRALVAMENADKNATYLTMYSPEIDPYSPRRLALMGELSLAIDEDELLLYFQPQIDINENTVIGVEALARWKHPEHGFIPPDEFIPLAEKTGLTRKLTRWVTDRALKECASLLKQGIELSISVNLSAQNLQETNFVTRVKSLLTKHNVPPELLTLELTETAVMLDPTHANQVLTQLSNHGIRISIDDFGTGYSSLSYIKQLPIHELKIDKSFILDMVTGKNDSVIVDTTLHMSHHLGLKVVAEGVETFEILGLLRELNCDIAQGYYLTRPLSINDLFDWLKSCPYQVGSIHQEENGK